MSKNAIFTGQPIFSQLLNLIDSRIVRRNSRKYNSDHYYKRFKTHHHLVTMLYTIFHKCTSVREVVTGMQVCQYKVNHLGMDYCPRRSTLSDANKKRSEEVFGAIYKDLYFKYRSYLPDSRRKQSWYNRLYMVDSTTIGLFKEILKNAGRRPINGKRKGGIKVHTLIKADEDIPMLVRMNAASSHDVPFIKGMKLPKRSIVVFDKGYNDYKQYDLWDQQQVVWVTRLKKASSIQILEKSEVSQRQQFLGVQSDHRVILGHRHYKTNRRIKARLINYYDKKKARFFQFITNNFSFAPHTIALIYKQRWQIEMLFKRIKQNYPLQYFIGDNENAIKIQIWCALIADLILKVVQSKAKRRWSFSNLSSMIRIHLMTYMKLYEFMNNPDQVLINYAPIQARGPTLFEY